MPKFFSADLIITNEGSPLKNAVIETTDEGTITGISEHFTEDTKQLKGVIVPGFVNAHCHLELSALYNVIPEKAGMAEFVSDILSKRFNASADEQLVAMKAADQQMYDSGIVAVGDISNFESSADVKKNSKLYYHTFVEVLGFDPAKAEEIFNKAKILRDLFSSDKKNRSGIVAHAPYTLSDELFELVKNNSGNISCIHMEESEEENDFCRFKTGLFAELFSSFGFNYSSFKSTADKSPLEKTLPKLNNKIPLQLVHNSFTKKEEQEWAEKQNENLYWCLCPNANLYITNHLPDLTLFNTEKRKVTIGTDSLASNHQLSILEEIKILQNTLQQIPFERLIKWATINGAEFLGIEEMYGSIKPGKKPGLVLIEEINSENLMLNKNTACKRII